LTAQHRLYIPATANGSTGRVVRIDPPAGFRVEQPLERLLLNAGDSQAVAAEDDSVRFSSFGRWR
jgi:hypothetical protein